MSRAPHTFRFVRHAAVLAAVALGASLAVLGGASATTTPGTPAQVAALVKASVSITTVSPTVAAELPRASVDIADVAYKIPALCTTATACVYGDTSSANTIVLFGNSHARMWLSAIIPIATADDYKLVLLGKNSCPVVTMNLNPTTYPECNTVIPESIAVIDALKPAVTILADRTIEPGYTGTQWENGMLATLKNVTKVSGKVAIIGDIQEFNFNPLTCVTVHSSKVKTDCQIANPNPKERSLASYEKAAAEKEKAAYINPVPWLCTTRCAPIIGSFVAYWDSDHVSNTYASYLSTVMGDALAPIIKAS